MKTLICVAVMLVTTVCNADVRFYNKSGSYAGRATTSQNGRSSSTTRFYGSRGNFSGSAVTRGRTTNLYNSRGSFSGSVRSR